MKVLCALLLLAGGAFALQGCKPDEYPSRLAVGEYGDVAFGCQRSECLRHQPQCQNVYFELSCPGPLSWVGGVADGANTHNLVPLQCCNVDGMKRAVDRGHKLITPGGTFQGEVVRDGSGRVIAYDVIKNIQKIQLGKGSYALEVSISRLSCREAKYQLSLGDGIGEDLVGAEVGIEQTGGFQGPLQPDFQQFNPGFGQDFGPPPFQPQPFAQPQLPPPLPPAQPPLPPIIPLGPAPVPVGGACFAEDSTVETPGGPKAMKDLKVGDLVMSIEEGVHTFTPVKSFIHRLPEQTARFNRIEAQDGSVVKLTPKHFIYRQTCGNLKAKPQMVYGKDVKEGDCLIRVDRHTGSTRQTPVVSNREIRQVGAYAPLTALGEIVVDNIYASCYSVYKNEEFMDSFVYYSDLIQGKMGSLFNSVKDHLPESVVELPWLMDFGRTFGAMFINTPK